jgi:hypothetical protein
VVDDVHPSNVSVVCTLYVLWRTPLLDDAQECQLDSTKSVRWSKSALSHDSMLMITNNCMVTFETWQQANDSNLQTAALVRGRADSCEHTG